MFEKFTKEEISIMFTHHHRKQGLFKPSNMSEQMRGSTDIAAMIDTHLLIDKKILTNENDKEELILIMSQPKQRSKEPIEPFKIKLEKNNESVKFIYDGLYSPENERSAKINEYMPMIADYIAQNDGCIKKDIEKNFFGKIGTRYVSEILNRLIKNSMIDVFSSKPKKYSIHRDSATIFDATANGEDYAVE